jgi:hypothetical protein
VAWPMPAKKRPKCGEVFGVRITLRMGKRRARRGDRKLTVMVGRWRGWSPIGVAAVDGGSGG